MADDEVMEVVQRRLGVAVDVRHDAAEDGGIVL